MDRQNKKEAIAALHKVQIMKAAERLFSEKGFAQTTINDISKTSELRKQEKILKRILKCEVL